MCSNMLGSNSTGPLVGCTGGIHGSENRIDCFFFSKAVFFFLSSVPCQSAHSHFLYNYYSFLPMEKSLSDYDQSLEELERQREELELVMKKMGQEWEERYEGSIHVFKPYSHSLFFFFAIV